MKILKYIFIGLLAVVGVLTLVGLFLPVHYSLSQSMVIHAPTKLVFQAVDNFKRWQHWSPWHLADPTNIVDYQGSAMGVGAIMQWHSHNRKVGTGKQEIVVSDPDRYIKMSINFSGWDKPTYATWRFKALSDTTTSVTWSYHTEPGSNIVYKYISLLMKPMLLKDYTQGLENLKYYAEKQYKENPVLSRMIPGALD